MTLTLKPNQEGESIQRARLGHGIRLTTPILHQFIDRSSTHSSSTGSRFPPESATTSTHQYRLVASKFGTHLPSWLGMMDCGTPSHTPILMRGPRNTS